MNLEHFQKSYSRAAGMMGPAVFLVFGFVSAQADDRRQQGCLNLLLRQRPMIGTIAKNQKSALRIGHIFSSNALISAKGWPVGLVLLLTAWLADSCASEAGSRPASGPGLVGGPRWTNSPGQVFVPVPGTRVQFCIWETRVRDFAAFAATRPKLDGTNWNNAFYHAATPVSAGPEYPVVNVSWNDAEAFCTWLTAREQANGTISAQQRYRLPTDEEWSVAVGIGGRETGATPRERSAKLEGVYPWGTQFPPPPGAGNFADEAALNYFQQWPSIKGYNDGFVTTAPVGSFQPNTLGIYDLAGNALEWCEDYYDERHQARVLRGGAWNNCGPRSLLSSYREHVAPDRCSVVTGFRCVLETGTVTTNGHQ